MYGEPLTPAEVNEAIHRYSTEPWAVIGFLNASYSTLRDTYSRLLAENDQLRAKVTEMQPEKECPF